MFLKKEEIRSNKTQKWREETRTFLPAKGDWLTIIILIILTGTMSLSIVTIDNHNSRGKTLIKKGLVTQSSCYVFSPTKRERSFYVYRVYKPMLVPTVQFCRRHIMLPSLTKPRRCLSSYYRAPRGQFRAVSIWTRCIITIYLYENMCGKNTLMTSPSP